MKVKAVKSTSNIKNYFNNNKSNKKQNSFEEILKKALKRQKKLSQTSQFIVKILT